MSHIHTEDTKGNWVTQRGSLEFRLEYNLQVKTKKDGCRGGQWWSD